MRRMDIETRSEEETLALAARLGRRAKGSALVCLTGPLGSGKTTFARGFLRGLGYRGRVASPTFALVHEYARLEPKVFHLDLYRLGEEEMGGFGLEDYLGDAKAACLIEWPEAARRWLPPDRLEVSIAHAPGGARRMRLEARGPRSQRLLAVLGRKGAR